MTQVSPAVPANRLVDEHSVLLWQTCAYADDLVEAARSRRRLTPAYDALLGFLHDRFLPYLSQEEEHLPAAGLRDERMNRLLLTDHERLRADVENVESSRTRRLLVLAADALVDRLDRHTHREEVWVRDPLAAGADVYGGEWLSRSCKADTISRAEAPREAR